MNTLSEIEKEAAPMLEYYGFREEDINEIIADLGSLWKRVKLEKVPKYTLAQCSVVLHQIFQSKELQKHIRDYLLVLRRDNTMVLEDTLPEFWFYEMMDHPFFENEEEFIKRCFYMYPQFTLAEMTEWCRTVIDQIAHTEIAILDNKTEKQLYRIGAWWMDYHHFLWPRLAAEMTADFRSYCETQENMKFPYRVCYKILKNIHGDPIRLAEARTLLKNKEQFAVKHPMKVSNYINDNYLREKLKEFREGATHVKGSQSEKDAFTKSVAIETMKYLSVHTIRRLVYPYLYHDDIGLRRGMVTIIRAGRHDDEFVFHSNFKINKCSNVNSHKIDQ